MGNFCEAFGIEKIEAPSLTRKRILQKKSPPSKPFRPRPKVTPTPTPAKPKPKPKGKGQQKTAKMVSPDISLFNAQQNKK